MNVEAVRAFIAIAEEGQFQLAAADLGISQQAVSKRLAALESDLGVRLFTRRRSRTCPVSERGFSGPTATICAASPSDIRPWCTRAR
jgi:DNA-binding transcriptional LysR family regulator